ncbi:MAG: hypothetical protein P1U67_06935 [Alcanivoracaceae bacterium]|nr:hypothetical protein [Alcanivoracaceae bacterium]
MKKDSHFSTLNIHAHLDFYALSGTKFLLIGYSATLKLQTVISMSGFNSARRASHFSRSAPSH